jgi:hypothetical protein
MASSAYLLLLLLLLLLCCPRYSALSTNPQSPSVPASFSVTYTNPPELTGMATLDVLTTVWQFERWGGGWEGGFGQHQGQQRPRQGHMCVWGDVGREVIRLTHSQGNLIQGQGPYLLLTPYTHGVPHVDCEGSCAVTQICCCSR